MNLYDLKSAIEQAIGIVSWSPTESDLLKVAQKISSLSGATLTRNKLSEILSEIIDSPIIRSLNEGEDNTDLNTLLLMCLRVANDAKK
ncbi:MAG: hypothetical protein HWE34_09120 [Methylocystaceae bacterium]|nr:hypothetical protein [Methylocystaceae bacterium]